MISEEIIYQGIISKGITFKLHLLLSIYPSLSLSLFISPYLFSCVFFISLLCVSLSLSQTSHTTLPMLNVFIIRSLNGLKILSFGHVNPRSGAPGAGGKGPLFVIILIFFKHNYSYDNYDYHHSICNYYHGCGLVQINLSNFQPSLFSISLASSSSFPSYSS